MREETEERPILPACLLVAGRLCLVVGGGRIATRKVGHLLDADADVTIVSPAVSEDLRAHVRRGRARHVAREFMDSDADGQYVVFAATDNEAVNRRVIASCRARRVLCSAVDANWPDGDFVTPAICREGGVVVTVSTGGRSCRVARIIKERLRHIVAEEMGGSEEHSE